MCLWRKRALAVLLAALTMPFDQCHAVPCGIHSCTGGPLSDDYDLVEMASEAALDVYKNPTGLMKGTKKGKLQVGVVLTEFSDHCVAAFRGPSEGFTWVQSIDMRKTDFKGCRVVNHYKKLYLNDGMDKKNGQRGYRKALDTKLKAKCWKKKKLVIFTGHDLGGAMATLAALEYSDKPMITFTFGQPPVFMPAQFDSPGRLSKKACKAHPCSKMNLEKYFQFINTDVIGGPGGHLIYDFMSFLHYFFYGIVDGATPNVKDRCVDKAGKKVKKFLKSSADGNLGSNFGSRYLLPARSGRTVGIETSVGFWQVPDPESGEEPNFSNQGDYGVMYMDLLAPELLNGQTNSCTKPPEIHSMQTYHDKIKLYKPNPFPTLPGLYEWAECNIDSDCASNFCYKTKAVGEDHGYWCLPNQGALTVRNPEDFIRPNWRKPPAGAA